MTTRSTEERIGDVALDVLRTNDTGTLVKAAPDLYPHQSSWDAAFVAIGQSWTAAVALEWLAPEP